MAINTKTFSINLLGGSLNDVKQKLMKALPALAFTGVIAIAPFSSQAALKLADVLASTQTHHPKIKAALAKQQQADLEKLSAEGAFDWQITQHTAGRVSGYYDGWYVDQAITKPIADYNAKFSARYRVSTGDFPIYENVQETLTGGEASVGVKFSLMRDRDIDAKRKKLQQADNIGKSAAQQFAMTENEMLYAAASSYLDWFAAVQRLNVLKQLVVLAENRKQAIEEKVARGDLAAMTKTEFRTTLLSRQASVIKAQRYVEFTAWKLSLYWRDDHGRPMHPEVSDIPTFAPKFPNVVLRFDDAWERRVLEQHPAIEALNAELANNQIDKRFAENNLLPTLDVEVKLAQDIGKGPDNLDGTESRVGLWFSVPLEQRQAKAAQQKAEAKRMELSWKKQALQETLHMDISTALVQLKQLRQIQAISQEQADVAQTLVQQEFQRFQAGDSDLFLLNARETQSGKAQLDALQAGVDLLKQQLRLLVAGADMKHAANLLLASASNNSRL